MYGVDKMIDANDLHELNVINDWNKQLIKIMSVIFFDSPLDAERFLTGVAIEAKYVSYVQVANMIYELAIRGHDVRHMDWKAISHVYNYRLPIRDRLGYSDEKLCISADIDKYKVTFISHRESRFELCYYDDWIPTISSMFGDVGTKYFDPLDYPDVFNGLEKCVCKYLDAMERLDELLDSAKITI